MTWPCFWMEPTFEAERGLRRYARSEGSSGFTCEMGYHNASVALNERIKVGIVEDADGWKHWDYTQGDITSHDDPRWPKACACGYEFTADDEWQDWTEPLYRRADNGELRVLHWTLTVADTPVAEPGAMWDNWWSPRDRQGIFAVAPDRPDDIVLMVRCPYMDDRSPSRGGQDWCVDHPSTGSGQFWTRTGDPKDPPTLTANPSIAIGVPGTSGYYHGWLHSGVLSDHLG